MKKILVAVDFSEASRKAMDYAAALASSFNAGLVLVHAFYMPAPVGDAPGYIPLSLTEVQEENEAFLQRELEYLASNFRIRADGYVRMGTATGVIRELAKEIGADLLVMGMKGAGHSISLFGSTVVSAIRKLKMPLLVIPEQHTFSYIKYICFACDFTEKAGSHPHQMLETIATHFNADVRVLHVQKNEIALGGSEVAGKMAADLALSRIRHSFHTMVDADVEKGINDFIATNPTDLLVMVSHHHNLFERLFIKEHSRQMVYQARIPLLVLHD